jgi:hypothetical protein
MEKNIFLFSCNLPTAMQATKRVLCEEKAMKESSLGTALEERRFLDSSEDEVLVKTTFFNGSIRRIYEGYPTTCLELPIELHNIFYLIGLNAECGRPITNLSTMTSLR